MERERGPNSKTTGVQVLVSIFVCLLFIGAYVAAMYALVDISRIDSDSDANRRTRVCERAPGLLVLVTVVGFGWGNAETGLGLAYGLLFYMVLVVAMLACAGRVVRAGVPGSQRPGSALAVLKELPERGERLNDSRRLSLGRVFLAELVGEDGPYTERLRAEDILPHAVSNEDG